MDVLIASRDGTNTVTLVSLGLHVIDFEESPPIVTRNSKSFAGRNGSIDYGGQHTSKTIKVSTYYYATNLTEDEAVQERVNGLLSGLDTYYLTQKLSDADQYVYERPGQKSGSIAIPQDTESYKRFLVYRTDNSGPEFQGKSGAGLLSSWDFEFATAELPYGESKPKDVTVASGKSIPYAGTTDNSQLEQPFYFEVVASAASATGFKLTVDDQVWEVRTPVIAGDIYKIAGMSNLRGDQNINDDTNYRYFVLHQGKPNKLTCSIAAKIKVKNLKNLYR